MAGRDVRLITAKETARLAAARELIQRRVEVRFQQALVLSDLRFTLIDDGLIIVGLVPDSSSLEQPSLEGIDVRSRRLVSILSQDYLQQWDSAATYDTYLQEVVANAREDPQCSAAMVAEQLGLPSEEILQLWEGPR
jgi:hypothetical protein